VDKGTTVLHIDGNYVILLCGNSGAVELSTTGSYSSQADRLASWMAGWPTDKK